MKTIPIRKTAWVSGMTIRGYALNVNVSDKDAEVFWHLNGEYFSGYTQAQDVANAIRGFVKLQRERRRVSLPRR